MSFDSFTRSANTSDNSTRSRGNSASSNNSQSSGHGNRRSKKKVSQKTLGVAWGANYRYMVEKNRKLQDQFAAEVAGSFHGASSALKPIFHGVSIFVDGFTVPSSQELRGCMLKYGGRFENYFSRHHVTHIICSNLPDSKVKNLRSFSGGLPVVKPQWVVDSVAANRLLSWVPYELNQVGNNQPKLSSFFTPKNASVAGDALSYPVCMADDVAESSLVCGKLEEKYTEVVETIEERMQSDERFEDESRDETIKNASAHCTVGTLQSWGAEPTFVKAGRGTVCREGQQQSPDEPSTSGSSHFLNKPILENYQVWDWEGSLPRAIQL